MCNTYCIEDSGYASTLENNIIYGTQGFTNINGLSLCLDSITKEDYVFGPNVIGVSDSNNNFDFVWKFYQDIQTNEYYYHREGLEPISAIDYFQPSVNAKNLSIGFDILGTLYLAIEDADTNLITIKKDIGEIYAYPSFYGVSPQFFYNGLVYDSEDDSKLRDCIIYYLKRTENKLFARFQRDNFSIEYVIIDDIPVNVSVLMFDKIAAFRLYFNIVSTNSKFAYSIYSAQFDSIITNLNDLSIFEATMQGGVHALVIIDAGIAQENQQNFEGTFTKNITFPRIEGESDVIDLAPFLDASIIDGSFDSFMHFQILVDYSDLYETQIGIMSYMHSSSYDEIVINSPVLDSPLSSFGASMQRAFYNEIYVFDVYNETPDTPILDGSFNTVDYILYIIDVDPHDGSVDDVTIFDSEFTFMEYYPLIIVFSDIIENSSLFTATSNLVTIGEPFIIDDDMGIYSETYLTRYTEGNLIQEQMNITTNSFSISYN